MEYLALALAIALVLVIVGAVIWIRYRGHRLADSEKIICNLRADVRRLEGAAEMRANKNEVEGAPDAEALADFNDRSLPLFDDTGEG